MSRGLLIKELPQSDRPRERLANLGADALKNSELIAILLRTGMKGVSAIQVAEQLLKRFDSLEKLSRANISDLCQIKGIGRDKAVALKSAFTLARRMAAEIRLESPILDTPDRIADLLRERQSGLRSRTFPGGFAKHSASANRNRKGLTGNVGHHSGASAGSF